MNSAMNETQQSVIKIVQELIIACKDRASVSPALIREKITLVTQLDPKWRDGFDHEAATEELIRRFSLWIGQDTALRSDIGHIQWLTASRKQDWRYWRRYREWLERRLSLTAVEALDRSTDSILGLLEEPLREGPWDRRGLVVGHVQSGKTGNYTGLICKAADAGYKIIIVLAGLHNNLRSQTQMRLDEGFLGYETSPDRDLLVPVGVGEIDGDPSIKPNYATNRSETGDFNTKIARHLGIRPEGRPWLFVVKKNKTVLERLYSWIRDHVADSVDGDSGRRIVTHLPIMLIDDEADHASVDTGEQTFGVDGSPDIDHHPTAINRCVRRILHAFTRSAYVGYTATPFANIFIHERAETSSEGPDLFPSAFIINLAAGSNYIGPAKVFGLKSREGREEGLPLVRVVKDHSTPDGAGGWMPQNHKNGHLPLYDAKDGIPPSLVSAVNAFLIACAVRGCRGQSLQHSSMLVHVSRFTSVQAAVHGQIQSYVTHVRQRLVRGIDAEGLTSELQKLWEQDFLPTSAAIENPGYVDGVSWAQIMTRLPEVLADIQVKMINGTAKDALDYADNAKTGLKVIAIGGDKLARGLTLEGLCVSYFLRASRLYDTLMQMGRWFGYRPGYLDLCRLYTTEELAEWFGHITDAAEELREEFDLMAASGSTPREFGLKVQSHSVLMVTSHLKMRTAKDLMLSFSGQLLETVALYRNPDILKKNLDALQRLLSRLGDPIVDPEQVRNGGRSVWKGYLWSGVSASQVIDFLLDYRTHPNARKVDSSLLAEFIRSMTQAGELTNWTVAIIGGGSGSKLELQPGISIDMLRRTSERGDDAYSIGRLMSPRDEAIDLDEAEWTAALKLTRNSYRSDPARGANGKEPESPSGVAIRRIRGFGADAIPAHCDRGLLALYALDPALASANFPPNTPAIIGFGISFPASNSSLRVEYKVNNVGWEQEYGPAE